MAAPSVSVYPSTTRIESADTTTGWSNDGGGGGIAAETDIVYQGSAAASRKVSTSVIGRAYTHGSGIDMDGTPATTAHVVLKVAATNYGALLTRTSPALHVKIGSDSSNYHTYYLFGNDNYPPTGGFQIIAVAPSVTGYAAEATDTGTPNDSAITYFSILGDFSASSKAENLVIDAIDVGLGLALVGGDGVSTDATFNDFVAADEGNSSNRWGFVTTQEGVLFAIGELAIGRNNTPSAVATEFTDAGVTVVWKNGLVTTGFNRLLLDLGGTGTAITMTNCSLGSQGQVNNDGDRGYTTTEDSRPIFQVTGTTGAATLNSCVIDNFASFTLNNKVTFSGCTITDSGQVDTGNGASLANSSISGYTGAANTSAVLWANTLDPDGELDGLSVTMGSTATHAIEFGITSPTSITLRDCVLNDFGSTNNSNDSHFHVKRTTGTVTINLVGCTTNAASFSYRTDGATVNIVEDPVTFTVTVTDIAGNYLTGARVLAYPANATGPLNYKESVTITQTGGVATVSHTGHGRETGDLVLIEGTTNSEDYNGIQTITVTGTDSYTFPVSSPTPSPATGTITSTDVIISGVTSGSPATISDTRTYSSAQPVSGRVRLSTSPNFYKTSPIVGTISQTAGLSITVQLIADT